MSSSTSSSERSARRIYVKILLSITLGMLAGMGIFRTFAYFMDARAETILDRVMEARAALPRIVREEKPLVMAFGSSMTHAGFSARQFDRQMAERGIEVKSFNFGFGGLNPYFQDYLSRRIRDAFQENDRRLELAMIELVPLQVTRSRWNGAAPVVDSFLTMLATPGEMWEITLDDPTRGIRLFNIHYLRNDISAEMTTWFFGEDLDYRSTPRSDLPVDEEAMQRLDELGEQLTKRFEEEYPDYEDSSWSYEWQGAGTIPEERSAETLELFPEYYEAVRQPRLLENDRLRRIACCDIEELNFEPILVEAFIRIVENFKEFSDHVEVVLLPKNGDWIKVTPEGERRLTELLERIARETGVPIRNFQSPDWLTPEMFGDTTHLARYLGDVRWTAHLVETYAPLLAE